MVDHRSCSSVPQRWALCVMCSWAFAMVSFKDIYLLEISFVVQKIEIRSKEVHTDGCPYLFATDAWSDKELAFEIPDLFWNLASVKIAYSAYFIGKMAMVVPAGVLSDLGYAPTVLVTGMSVMAVHHFFTPTSITFGFNWYVALCVLSGMSESMIYPGVFALLSRCTPPSRRNYITAVVVAGHYYGTALGQLSFNALAALVKFQTWTVWNFLVGGIALTWLVCWFVHTTYWPYKFPVFYRHETGISSSMGRRRTLQINLQRIHLIPWRQIFSSRPFLSLLLVYCAVDWASCLDVWIVVLPYQRHILHLPSKLADYASVMTLAGLPSSVMAGLFTDWVVNHKIATNTLMKRTFVLLSVFCSSALELSLALVTCDVVLFWVVIVVAIYFSGLAVPAIFSSPIDLSPRYAGLLAALMTGTFSVCALFDFSINEILIPKSNVPTYWRNKFIYFTLLTVVLSIPFLFCGSGEMQLWSSSRSRRPAQSVVPAQNNLV